IAGPTPLDERFFVEVGHSPTILESEYARFVSQACPEPVEGPALRCSGAPLKQFIVAAGLIVPIAPSRGSATLQPRRGSRRHGNAGLRNCDFRGRDYRGRRRIDGCG